MVVLCMVVVRWLARVELAQKHEGLDEQTAAERVPFLRTQVNGYSGKNHRQSRPRGKSCHLSRASVTRRDARLWTTVCGSLGSNQPSLRASI